MSTSEQARQLKLEIVEAVHQRQLVKQARQLKLEIARAVYQRQLFQRIKEEEEWKARAAKHKYAFEMAFGGAREYSFLEGIRSEQEKIIACDGQLRYPGHFCPACNGRCLDI